MWVSGDTVVSLLLLWLFVRPLRDICQLGKTPETIASLKSMRRITEINRNLLMFTVLFTLCVITIGVFGNFKLRTVLYMCAMERLVTLQCITMTFSYHKREYFYCCTYFLLCLRRKKESELNHEASSDVISTHGKLSSPSVLVVIPVQGRIEVIKNESFKVSLSSSYTSSDDSSSCV